MIIDDSTTFVTVEWLSLGIQNGWRDTVDRLAAELASITV